MVGRTASVWRMACDGQNEEPERNQAELETAASWGTVDSVAAADGSASNCPELCPLLYAGRILRPSNDRCVAQRNLDPDHPANAGDDCLRLYSPAQAQPDPPNRRRWLQPRLVTVR